MSISTHTESVDQKVFDFLCPTGLTSEISYQVTGLVVLNVFLALIATAGNTLILVALNKVSTLHPPSKLMFRNLAATDLCVGVIGQPLYTAYVILLLMENVKICRYTLLASFVVGSILGGVSLPTLTVISVDRLLALLLRLKYRQVDKSASIQPLGCSCCLFSDERFKLQCYPTSHQHSRIVIFNNVNIFLHVDFLRSSSSSTPSSKRFSTRTTEPNNSIKHNTIQKGSVQCAVGAVGANCLLPPLWDSSGLVGLHWTSVSRFSSGSMHNHTGVFQFLLKPSHLLLED